MATYVVHLLNITCFTLCFCFGYAWELFIFLALLISFLNTAVAGSAAYDCVGKYIPSAPRLRLPVACVVLFALGAAHYTFFVMTDIETQIGLLFPAIVVYYMLLSADAGSCAWRTLYTLWYSQNNLTARGLRSRPQTTTDFVQRVLNHYLGSGRLRPHVLPGFLVWLGGFLGYLIAAARWVPGVSPLCVLVVFVCTLTLFFVYLWYRS